ncbi:hypothetical protein OG864_29810 [Streptomyces sp. NBC_00124]|uniref:hypothetical protein n=1 Tax=Streptomyces sp. NBC_00124 TaxID=2975662 RepID=UPI002251027C|nr:hypothetical protein [Streptomyces sp. NBC_00124]MCX5362898.1 hypothetical protein [Streptomyces sp. NBC_00124]
MKPTAQRRRDRRDLLDNLLGRALRGRLTVTEAALLAEQVREEQRAYDQTRRSLGETTDALTKNREAADAAVQEQEERAKRAEQQLAGYVTVFGPRAVDDFHAMQHRAKRAEAALDRVRDAQRLGEALAAVAEYDGLTPEAARANAAFIDAADSTTARLAEQQREHAIALATVRKTLSESETLGHLLLKRAEQAEAAVAQTKGLMDRRTRTLHQRAETAETQHAQINRHLDRMRTRAEQAEHCAARYRLAWLAARRDRKADRAAMAAELPLLRAGQHALAVVERVQALAAGRRMVGTGAIRAALGQER